VRFVYVTHDLNFALSRRNATYVLASPTAGLRSIDLASSVPEDVAEALIGSASLSFYASRVVFCEGEETSLDGELYRAWFNGPDTVVRSVGGCERVLRCVDALRNSGITTSLSASGILDRDNHASAFLDSLPAGVHVLPVHEIESMYSLPAVVKAICEHNAKEFVESDYVTLIRSSVSADQAEQIVIDRWKARIEPHLGALVSGVDRTTSIASVSLQIPTLFDPATWAFNPVQFLTEEQQRVTTALQSNDPMELLRIIPGKQILAIAARAADSSYSAYIRLVTKSLAGLDPALKELGDKVASALSPHLPSRYVVAALPMVPA
jgi:hypothetical protein